MAWWKAGPTPREMQLASLEQAFPDAKKTVQGNACHYDMVCLGSINLRVFVPPRFPDEKPVLQLLSGHLDHPWVNPHHQVVGHPSLQRWHPQVELPKILAEVIAELAVFLPSDAPPFEGLAAAAAVAPPSYEAAATPFGGSGLPPPLPPRPLLQRLSEESYEVPTPEVPSSFPELEAMDAASLEQLLTDDAAFHTLVNGFDAVVMMQELRADALRANAKTAAATLSARPALEALRTETLALEAQLLARRDAYAAKVATQRAADDATSSDAAILQALQASAADAEDASERELDAFCRKEIEVRMKHKRAPRCYPLLTLLCARAPYARRVLLQRWGISSRITSSREKTTTCVVLTPK
jgi:hypothetical protein